MMIRAILLSSLCFLEAPEAVCARIIPKQFQWPRIVWKYLLIGGTHWAYFGEILLGFLSLNPLV